ncbi:MAG: NAD(P)/FAD-dependent oxidoreductase [Phycisphaerales bacterium]
MALRVAIIGAGPAGCAAAITLARGGHEVRLIEREVFPRQKVCGECISPAATGLLRELLHDGAGAPGDLPTTSAYTLEVGDAAHTWQTPHETMACSRAALDSHLLLAARGLGARVQSPATVQRVEYGDASARVVLADGSIIAADCVVHADGSGRHDPAGATPMRPGVVGCKCRLAMTRPPRAIHMRSAPGAYIGLVTTEEGLTTCALTVRSDVVARAKRDLDGLLKGLWPGFDPAWRATLGTEGAWRTCGIASAGYISPGHPRSLRVGNAAAAVEPVGGEGIGLALWSGVEVGRRLCEVRNASSTELAGAERRLARAYRARLRWRRPACRIAAEVLMRPMLVRTLWPVLRRPALALHPWWRLSGKPA